MAIRQLCLAILVVASLARTSEANIPTEGASDTDAEAVELSVAGKRAYAAKKYDEAYSAFREVWARKKTVTTAANLAMVELRLGKMRDAAEHFQFALAHSPFIDNPENSNASALLQKRLDEAKAHIGTLALRIDVPGAQVRIDSIPRDALPFEEIFLDPGQRILEVSRPGYKPFRRALSVTAGWSERLEIKLERLSPADGPLLRSPQQPAEGAAQAQPNQSSSVPWNEIILGAGGVTGGALMVTGVIYAVSSNESAGQAKRLHASLLKAHGSNACTVPENAADCGQLDTLRAEQNASADVALGTLLAGGTVTAATLVYYAVLASKQPATPAVQVFPVAGAGNAGLLVRGQW
jgi:hypothetical protein